jgi:hypothetical protein
MDMALNDHGIAIDFDGLDEDLKAVSATIAHGEKLLTII